MGFRLHKSIWVQLLVNRHPYWPYLRNESEDGVPFWLMRWWWWRAKGRVVDLSNNSGFAWPQSKQHVSLILLHYSPKCRNLLAIDISVQLGPLLNNSEWIKLFNLFLCSHQYIIYKGCPRSQYLIYFTLRHHPTVMLTRFGVQWTWLDILFK